MAHLLTSHWPKRVISQVQSQGVGKYSTMVGGAVRSPDKGCGYRLRGRQLVTIMQSTTDFPPWKSRSCYVGLGLWLESVTDSQWESKFKYDMALLNLDSFSSCQRRFFQAMICPQRASGRDIDTVGFADLLEGPFWIPIIFSAFPLALHLSIPDSWPGYNLWLFACTLLFERPGPFVEALEGCRSVCTLNWPSSQGGGNI